MGFREIYQRARRRDWFEHYIDYAALVALLRQFAVRRSERVDDERADLSSFLCGGDTPDFVEFLSFQDDGLPTRHAVDATDASKVHGGRALLSDEKLCMYEREEFCRALDSDIQRVTVFYCTRLTDLQAMLAEAKRQASRIPPFPLRKLTYIDRYAKYLPPSTSNSNSEEDHVPPELQRWFSLVHAPRIMYQEIADQSLELYVYVATNITAMRQALIRFDARIRLLDGPPLAQWYLVTRKDLTFFHGQDGGTLSFHDFLFHHGLLKMCGDVNVCLQRLQERLLRGITTLIATGIRGGTGGSQANLAVSVAKKHRDVIEPYLRRYIKELSVIESHLVKTERSVDKVTRGHFIFTDGILYSLRFYLLQGALMNELTLQPGFVIAARGKTLREEILFFAKWTRNRSALKIEQDLKKIHAATINPMRAAQGADYLSPLIITYLSRFLSVTHQCVVEPSSVHYMTQLGGHEALAGLLMGTSAVASLIGAFMFSIWTNTSYRQPAICSGLLNSSGSLMYALAGKYESLGLAFAGQFFTGLGTPAAINRRRIADTVPAASRTAQSASFAAASAIGMAIGPAAAVLLDFVNWHISIPIPTGHSHTNPVIVVNGTTGPGYLMFVLWTLWLLLVICKYREPVRIGVLELEIRKKISSPTTTRKTKAYEPPPLATQSREPIDFLSSENDERYRAPDNDQNNEDEEEEDDDSEENNSPYTTKEEDKSVSSSPLVNRATVVCMLFVFLGKFSFEIFNDSVSILTYQRYDWSIKSIGLLGLTNGCLVVPISTMVGYISQHYTDRSIMKGLLLFSLLGVCCMVDITDFQTTTPSTNEDDDEALGYNDTMRLSVGPWRYIIGQIINFAGSVAFESVTLSTMSKVISIDLAKGTFNAAFLTILLGTLGHSFGDAFITVMGLADLRNLLNLLSLPALVAILLNLILLWRFRHKLSV